MGADRGTPAPGTAELSFTTKKTGSSRLRPDTVKDVEGNDAVLGFGGISTQRAWHSSGILIEIAEYYE